MRSAIIGAVLLVAGGVAVAVGILPPGEAEALFDRVWPILLFVVAITIVTELAARAGLFRATAERLAVVGRGRTWLLWLAVVALAVLCTVFLSLDTTAVLLTPVVVLLARHVHVNPLPFALTTVWLANTGSMLLPVSNLTNLLAEHAIDGSVGDFIALTWAPAIVAIVVPVIAILVIGRRDLLTRYEPAPPTAVDDRVLLVVSAIVVVLLLPALVSGIEVWIPASIAAVVLVVVFLVRHPSAVRFGLVPWQLVVFAGGLFVAIEAAQQLGLASVLAAVAGTGSSPAALLHLAGAGALASNVANNLPAYLALEPVAGSPLRIVALLVGVNAGPLITPWASLATLLWHRQLTASGVTIAWRRYILLGAVVAPITVVLATLALAAVGG